MLYNKTVVNYCSILTVHKNYFHVMLVRHVSNVRKSYIACLNSRGAIYISVGQLQLELIGLKLKSNIVSKPIAHLGSHLF